MNLSKKKRSIVILFLVMLVAIAIKENVRAAKKSNIYFKSVKNYGKANSALSLINAKRAQKGLSALKMDKKLLKSAMKRSEETVVFFGHKRPNNKKWSSVSSKVSAENIAINNSTKSLVSMWMNSGGHRSNILNRKFKSTGIGCVKHNNKIYWVQVFSYKKAKRIKSKGAKKVLSKVSATKRHHNFRYGSVSKKVVKGSKKRLTLYKNNLGWGHSKLIPHNKTFKWKSNNSKRAVVSSKGLVKFSKTGIVDIFAQKDEKVYPIKFSVQN